MEIQTAFFQFFNVPVCHAIVRCIGAKQFTNPTKQGMVIISNALGKSSAPSVKLDRAM